VNKRIDDALISQVRDHGKRISALEAWRVWLIGWAAGAGVVSHFIFQLFEK
jgi:predicted membrane protein